MIKSRSVLFLLQLLLLSALQLFVSFGLLNYFFPLLPLLRPLFPIGHPHLPQIIPHVFFPSLSNFPDKNCRENQNTHFTASNFFRNRTGYETMLKIILKPDRPQDDDVMRCMRIACWTPKGTNTHKEYVIIIALPLQHWLHGRPSMLRHTHSAGLVYVNTEVRCDDEHSIYT